MSPVTRAGRRRHDRFAVLASAAVLGSAGLLTGACSNGSAKAVAVTTSSTATTSSAPSTTSAPPTTSSPTTSSPAPTTTTPKPTPSPQPTTTSGLTLLQQAGQRVIYSYQGLTPPAALLQAIRNGQAAGVIFFSGNVSSSSQIAGVVSELRQAQQASPVHVPLLLMTDQEGGLVRRLPGGPTLSEKQVGQSSDPSSAAAQAGTSAAQTLGGVGMNVNLAPVLDVYYQAGNFIDQTQRSFSSDPSVVSNLGHAFISAQQNDGVAATAKHFPGLGSAPAGSNTDLRPVTLTVSLSNLRGTDEVPYQAAIGAGVKLVMLSWAVYPALDANRPAGLSSIVVQQELRTRMGFQGVTITDALEAGALTAYGTPGERARDAAGAGMDLLLCSSGDVNQGIAATSALADAVNSGYLSRSGFDAAVGRVTALRSGLH